MRKFLAVVKREYFKLVWSKAFLIGTLLVPLLGLGFLIVPTLIFSIEGDTTRIAVIDQSGKLYEDIKIELSPEKQVSKQAKRSAPNVKNAVDGANDSQEDRLRKSGELMKARFAVENINIGGAALETLKQEQNKRLRENELDAYIIVPPDFENQIIEYYARNTSDFIGQSRIEDALNQAVRRVRMQAANISQSKLDDINRDIDLRSHNVSETGEKEDSGESFFVVFVVGLLIYLTLAIYGQQILAAVVEEKETRIAEILFSSARPFTLMMGKLVGVGLVALTQLGIWILSAAAVLLYGAASLAASGISFSLPNISIFFVLVLFIFFLLGFFTYATIYALIGSMVTTVQEGGQLALPPMLLLLIGFYSSFPVIRNPNSDFSFWMSIAPFLSPMVMPVRMAIQTPPLWQILLSIALSLAAIMALTWLAARAYRVGMLMNGKRATIPEVWRWITQP